MKERLLAELGIELVVDETFTPPLADATPLVQKIRATRPDLLFFLPTVISDAKLVLEKMNEFGLGQGRIPTEPAVGVGGHYRWRRIRPGLAPEPPRHQHPRPCVLLARP